MMKWQPVISKYRLQHFAGWLMLYLLWFYFRYEDYPGKAGLITLIKVADLALMVYISNYLLIPFLLYRKRYLLFISIYIVMIAGFSILKMQVEAMVFGRPGFFDLTSRLKARIYDNIIPHFLLVSTAAAFKLLADYAKAQGRIGTLAKEKAETELQFLKSQINPHFLFNSLNAIYFLIDKQNTGARQTLLQFSDLLRYQLYDCNEDTVSIEKELVYLRNYITLQQLRKDHAHCEITMHSGNEVAGFAITPLLLIPFVENACKHVSSHAEKINFVRISLRRERQYLLFETSNSKEPTAVSSGQGGIGLANVKRRLELLYPGRHVLNITDTEEMFTVSLRLTIDK